MSDPPLQPFATMAGRNHIVKISAELPPLFVPLKMKYWLAFRDGTKTTEHRTYGRRWNEHVCVIGRAVTLSGGYGRKHRLQARIVGFAHVEHEARISLQLEPLPAPQRAEP